MRTPIDRLVTYNTLRHMDGNSFLLDQLLEKDDSVPLKNVCAKVHPDLADEIDGICGLLSISKRSFLEAAMIEAINKAKEIMEREGLHEYLQERK